MNRSASNCLAKLRGVQRALQANRPALLLFLITFISTSYFFHRFRFWNVNSRLDLTYAIVDDHSFRIDKYVNHPFYETKDRAFFKGHYYSDKIIGLSLLAVPVYWAVKQVFALVHKDPKPDLSRYALTVLIVSLSSSLLTVLLWRLLLLLGQTPSMASLIVLLFAFGTMIFPFSSLFYPYLPSLFFLMTPFYLAIRWKRAGALGRRPSWPIGLLLGMALLCEYTLAIPAVLILLYYGLALRSRWKILSCLAGVALPLSLFAGYNWICFDDPFTLPYRYLDQPEFQAGMGQGLMGIRHFQWYVLWLITLHPYRGIFFYSPFLFLGYPGIVYGLKSRLIDDRRLALIVIVVVIYYLVLNASYYMWWGGGTPLARHLLPMLPFLALAFAWLPQRARSLLLTLGFISVVLVGTQSVVEPHFMPRDANEALYRPWETVRRTGQGFMPIYLQHALPEFLRGRISINPFNRHIFATDGQGWTLLPLLAIDFVLVILLRRSLRWV